MHSSQVLKSVIKLCTHVLLAGLRLVAVAQQQGNTRRTLYAALSHHLKLASDDVAIAHVASVLKHLPLLGTAK